MILATRAARGSRKQRRFEVSTACSSWRSRNFAYVEISACRTRDRFPESARVQPSHRVRHAKTGGCAFNRFDCVDEVAAEPRTPIAPVTENRHGRAATDKNLRRKARRRCPASSSRALEMKPRRDRTPSRKIARVPPGMTAQDPASHLPGRLQPGGARNVAPPLAPRPLY